jgi:hypothetical protein
MLLTEAGESQRSVGVTKTSRRKRFDLENEEIRIRSSILLNLSFSKYFLFIFCMNFFLLSGKNGTKKCYEPE